MDYNHPFRSKPRLLIGYGVFWVLVSTLFVLITTIFNNVSFGRAMVEVFFFLIFYATIGSAIWYVIKYSTIEDKNVFQLISTHLISATIIVFIWMYIGTVFIKIIDPKSRQWIADQSLTRAIAGYVMYMGLVVFFYAVNYYMAFKEKVQNEVRLKALVKEAELHALKSQINPHFLFNSLNSISSLTMTNPARAQEMVINLSQLMRYSLKHDQHEMVSLKHELENNKLYLSIEKVRFGKKLNPVFDINEECLEAEIPNMILQPLYENAIKYGVYEALSPVDITTHCKIDNGLIIISINNIYDKNVQRNKGEGIGLRNIRDRLQVIYGNPHLLKIKNENNNFTVTLTIPQNLKEDDKEATDNNC